MVKRYLYVGQVEIVIVLGLSVEFLLHVGMKDMGFTAAYSSILDNNWGTFFAYIQLPTYSPSILLYVVIRLSKTLKLCSKHLNYHF